MRRFVAAIDQGTTSTRCLVFDRSGQVIALAGKEHRQFFPQPGWVEHDPATLWHNTQEVLERALRQADLTAANILALGITNQRETTLVWERDTGRPISPAIVWQDTRTDQLCAELAGQYGRDRYVARTGLPLSTYFSGPKLRWILDNVPNAQRRAEAGDLCFGTVDSWLLWNFTGRHLTDVTNASRTLLCDLSGLHWDRGLCADFGVPAAVLPEIRSSSEVYGEITAGVGAGIPVAGILGDQQAATFGQACLRPGEAKNTYGTGNFLLSNTGTTPIFSRNGLLTTVCYRLGDQPAVYALEGSIAVTGSLVQWLRDNLGIIEQAADIEPLARSVPDTGGAYIVPAFSGLFAPRWRPDARGAIVGLTRYVTKAHLARAALEATAFQTCEVIDAMRRDITAAIPRDITAASTQGMTAAIPRGTTPATRQGTTPPTPQGKTPAIPRDSAADTPEESTSALPRNDSAANNDTFPKKTPDLSLAELRVDGGMVANDLLMQIQADVVDLPVIRPVVAETTALGAAYAAGLAVGYWSSTEDIRDNWAVDRIWHPRISEAQRRERRAQWDKAVARTYDWV